MLARHHAINGAELASAIRRVAEHRNVRLLPLAQAFDDYGQIGQQRWTAWRRRQRLEDRLPEQFGDVVAAVIDFADSAILGSAEGDSWEPTTRKWS
jgi:hypothetical protein